MQTYPCLFWLEYRRGTRPKSCARFALTSLTPLSTDSTPNQRPRTLHLSIKTLAISGRSSKSQTPFSVPCLPVTVVAWTGRRRPSQPLKMRHQARLRSLCTHHPLKK
jgi:hypothetical protein